MLMARGDNHRPLIRVYMVLSHMVRGGVSIMYIIIVPYII